MRHGRCTDSRRLARLPCPHNRFDRGPDEEFTVAPTDPWTAMRVRGGDQDPVGRDRSLLRCLISNVRRGLLAYPDQIRRDKRNNCAATRHHERPHE